MMHHRKLLSHDVNPAVQLVKYALAGTFAFALHIGIFFLAGWFLFPCLTATDPLVRLLGLTPPPVLPAVRAYHAIYGNGIGFVVANYASYILNRRFVFRPGRHHWIVEIGLFYAASGISLLVGSALMCILIGHFGMDTTQAFGSNIISGLLINYLARKYLIFHG